MTRSVVLTELTSVTYGQKDMVDGNWKTKKIKGYQCRTGNAGPNSILQ